MDFFVAHSPLFLLGLIFFPRITVWFFSNVIGGEFFWPGFLVVPRAYCAVLGVLYYWPTNPVLATLGVIAAMVGEPLEKWLWYRLLSCKYCVNRRNDDCCSLNCN